MESGTIFGAFQVEGCCQEILNGVYLWEEINKGRVVFCVWQCGREVVEEKVTSGERLQEKFNVNTNPWWLSSDCSWFSFSTSWHRSMKTSDRVPVHLKKDFFQLSLSACTDFLMCVCDETVRGVRRAGWWGEVKDKVRRTRTGLREVQEKTRSRGPNWTQEAEEVSMDTWCHKVTCLCKLTWI